MASSALSVIFLILAFLESSGKADGNVCSGGNQYMCVDWSFGSQRMSYAQYFYKKRTGEDVFFGIGAYGNKANNNMGKCYKFIVETANRPFIAQVTNEGPDVRANQFDMQMGAGGFGIYNGCAAPTDEKMDKKPCGNEALSNVNGYPLFPGGKSGFGARCGGHMTRSGCSAAPDKPSLLGSLPTVGGVVEASLKDLCRRAFDWGARKNHTNSKIISGQRVPCPQELRDITHFMRSDETNISGDEMAPEGELTSTMDCCAPSASFVGNNINAHPDYPRVIPCTQDGYTRLGYI